MQEIYFFLYNICDSSTLHGEDRHPTWEYMALILRCPMCVIYDKGIIVICINHEGCQCKSHTASIITKTQDGNLYEEIVSIFYICHNLNDMCYDLQNLSYNLLYINGWNMFTILCSGHTLPA